MTKSIPLITALLLSLAVYSQQTNQTVTIGGVQRNYIQYLPVGFNAATETLPVVFVLHGIGGNAQEMTAAGMNLVADTARFIIIYPQGVPNTFGANSWNNGTVFLSSTADDMGFFNTMMDNYLMNFNADISRIYMCGLSMGGIMSHHLACKMNNRIAAIGSMSGTIATSTMDFHTTNPLTYKTPVIHFHGTLDDVVPYAGDALPSLELVAPTMNFWRNANNCDNTADSIRLPNTASDGLTVDRFVYNNCDQEGAVELWRINGGTHTYFYEPLNDFTEAIEIWLFFARWSHPNASPLGINDVNDSQITAFPNPSEGKLQLTGFLDMKVNVYQSNGKFIGEFDLGSNKEIDLSNQQAGIYFITSESIIKPISIIIN